MTVQLKNYKPSNPSEAANTMAELRRSGYNCPMCGRVSKWFYNFHQRSSSKDLPHRCVSHEMNPVPGPDWASTEERITQLY